jgi:hypothetical protein
MSDPQLPNDRSLAEILQLEERTLYNVWETYVRLMVRTPGATKDSVFRAMKAGGFFTPAILEYFTIIGLESLCRDVEATLKGKSDDSLSRD